MEMTNLVLFGIYLVIAGYVLYLLFFKKNPYQKEYERMYNEILNSEKYKVKGQWSGKER